MTGTRVTHNGNRKKVLELTLEGFSAPQIGGKLGIAAGTVYHHRFHLRQQGKLGDPGDYAKKETPHDH